MLTEPVTGKDFFGRLEHKTLLNERAKAFKSGFRQNIAILGRPFIGKSSLVKDFLANLSDDQVVCVYVECREEPFEFFANRFIGSILYQYLKLKHIDPKKDDAKSLIALSKKILPKTAEAIEKIEELIKKNNLDSAYDTLLDLPHLVETDSGAKCIVVIEEFDGLSYYKIVQPFVVLGKKIMAQRNTFYILTSSRAVQAKQILAEKLQLLFGNFEIIELDEFDFSTSRNFLQSKLEPFAISDDYLAFLVSFTNGHPFYLNAISSRLKELILSQGKRRVSQSLVEESLNEVLFRSGGQLNQHFTNIIYRYCKNKNSVDVLSVLVALSDKNHNFQVLAENFNSSANKISGVVTDLENAGLVTRTGGLNRIEDSVLRFWLKSVCHKKRMDFTLDTQQCQKAFVLQIKKILADLSKAAKEDLYEKIVDLFKTFNNEIVEINSKRHVLPVFNDVAIRVVGEAGPYIIGHSKGKNWICQIRKRKITEKQVSDFLKDTKTSKYEFQRKILIVLDGLDDNAKLLAKESDLWVWDLKTLNLLLDLYHKHKVIIY